MFKHILIPTDGSALSRKAIKAGVALARSTGARVTGFYSPERYEILAYGEYFPPDLISRDEWENRSRKTALRFLAGIEKEAKAAGVKYAGRHLDSVAPWEAIVEAARKNKCDLIFMARTHRPVGTIARQPGRQGPVPFEDSRPGLQMTGRWMIWAIRRDGVATPRCTVPVQLALASGSWPRARRLPRRPSCRSIPAAAIGRHRENRRAAAPPA